MQLQAWFYSPPGNHSSMNGGIYIFDHAYNGPHSSADAHVRMYGLYWDHIDPPSIKQAAGLDKWIPGEWTFKMGPSAIYNHTTHTYRFLNKDGWNPITWLQVLVTTGYTEEKVIQFIKRYGPTNTIRQTNSW